MDHWHFSLKAQRRGVKSFSFSKSEATWGVSEPEPLWKRSSSKWKYYKSLLAKFAVSIQTHMVHCRGSPQLSHCWKHVWLKEGRSGARELARDLRTEGTRDSAESSAEEGERALVQIPPFCVKFNQLTLFIKRFKTIKIEQSAAH